MIPCLFTCRKIGERDMKTLMHTEKNREKERDTWRERKRKC